MKTNFFFLMGTNHGKSPLIFILRGCGNLHLWIKSFKIFKIVFSIVFPVSYYFNYTFMMRIFGFFFYRQEMPPPDLGALITPRSRFNHLWILIQKKYILHLGHYRINYYSQTSFYQYQPSNTSPCVVFFQKVIEWNGDFAATFRVNSTLISSPGLVVLNLVKSEIMIL